MNIIKTNKKNDVNFVGLGFDNETGLRVHNPYDCVYRACEMEASEEIPHSKLFYCRRL